MWSWYSPLGWRILHLVNFQMYTREKFDEWISQKMMALVKCISGFKFGVILGIYVRFGVCVCVCPLSQPMRNSSDLGLFFFRGWDHALPMNTLTVLGSYLTWQQVGLMSLVPTTGILKSPSLGDMDAFYRIISIITNNSYTKHSIQRSLVRLSDIPFG